MPLIELLTCKISSFNFGNVLVTNFKVYLKGNIMAFNGGQVVDSAKAARAAVLECGGR